MGPGAAWHGMVRQGLLEGKEWLMVRRSFLVTLLAGICGGTVRPQKATRFYGHFKAMKVEFIPRGTLKDSLIEAGKGAKGKWVVKGTFEQTGYREWLFMPSDGIREL